MAHRSLFCYAWDLEEQELPAVIAEFRNWHVNAITLAGSYHAGKFLRPHGLNGKVYFPQDGTAYFKITPQRYGTIKPVVNDLIAKFDAFDVLCQLDDMPVTAWMVLLHNSRIGQLHPDACVCNAFGDRYLYSLCPACPAVREYAIALCCDIAEQYPIEGMTLESPGFLPFEHGYHHEFALVSQNSWLNNYLGLCFCQDCVQQAGETGIDAASLKRRVRDRLESYLSGDVDYTPDMAEAFWTADIVTDPDLCSFLRWRCDTVRSLVAQIKSALRSDLTLSVIPSVARPTSGAWYEGSNLNQLADVCDFLEICFYEPSTQRIMSDLSDLRSRLGETVKLRGIIRPGYPDLNDKQNVIDVVRALHDGGVAGISFYNYGHLKNINLEWMGEALGQLESNL